MITCNLMGGLGNQLFQIFTTINYSLLSKNPFKFINIEILGSGTTTIRHTYWNSFLNKLKHFLVDSFNVKMEILREKDFTFNQINLNDISNKNICLYGYFQSYKYFEQNFNTIYKLLNIQDKKNILNDKLKYDEEFYKKTISIHFRLGDYKKLKDYHPILPYEYYEKSLKYILNNDTDIKNVFYFCENDDHNDVKKIIEKLESELNNNINNNNLNDIKFMRVDSKLEDWEQILVMSCCKHNIIANSTFSWWGAYLNLYDHKIVCYPYLWFGPAAKNNTKDLFPITWIKINF